MDTPIRSHRTRALVGAGLAAGLACSAVAAAPATARPIDQGTYSDGYHAIVEDFCDVPGLTVEIDGSVSVRYLFNARKPGTAPYYLEYAVGDTSYTNEAGVTVTEHANVMNKDLKITDNGDGTITIRVLATGGATVYGPDGKAIARNPGQVRYDILIDYAGTIDDPSDDVFVADLGLVKGSTGRNDDFCEAVTAALG